MTTSGVATGSSSVPLQKLAKERHEHVGMWLLLVCEIKALDRYIHEGYH
jgi:hypothetical protein